jgi:hypothetical protein
VSRVVVFHGVYGCETGCCGHYVEVDGDVIGRMDFGHPNSRLVQAWQDGKFVTRYELPDEAKRDYARDLITELLGAEHVADIDWDNCLIVDD